MDQSIKAGAFGVSLVVIIDVLSPIYLDFVLPFLAAILAVYIFRLETFKDGLVASFMTYILSDGILSTIGLATFYAANKQYTLSVDLWTVFNPIVTSITALIAGYIGVLLVQKTRRESRELPAPLPPQLPPV
jgi:pheromone shutdown protein TraB